MRCGFLTSPTRPINKGEKSYHRWKTSSLRDKSENTVAKNRISILKAEDKENDSDTLEKENRYKIETILKQQDLKTKETEEKVEEEIDYLSMYFGEEENVKKKLDSESITEELVDEEKDETSETGVLEERIETVDEHDNVIDDSSRNIELQEEIDDSNIEPIFMDMTDENASNQVDDLDSRRPWLQLDASTLDMAVPNIEEEVIEDDNRVKEIEFESETTNEAEITIGEIEVDTAEEEESDILSERSSDFSSDTAEELELDPLLQHITNSDSKRLKASYQKTEIDPNSPEYKKIIALTRQRSYATLLIEKSIEALEDAYSFYQSIGKSKMNPQYYRRKWKGGQLERRKKIVVLGTGWGAHSFIQDIDAIANEVTVISPRNFFLFTPMLAASAVGTVESRSISEPIRQVNPYVDYLEATCTDIDYKNKKVSCESVICEGLSCEMNDFEVEYDELVISVGAKTADYGIPGVKEYAHFLKDLPDAARLRSSIGNCFERANVPGLSQEQRQRQLTFVVVGGGPTGVEFASELRDLICDDLSRFYSNLIPDVSIKLVEASDKVLSMFDEGLQEEALNALESSSNAVGRQITDVLLQKGVKEIRERDILLTDESILPYGLVVWAAGNGPLPLIESLVEKVPEQKAFIDVGRGRLVTDPWCRVNGCKGILGIGDCTVNEDAPLPATAQVASQQGSYLARLFNKDCNFNTKYPEIPNQNTLQPLVPKDSEEDYSISEPTNTSNFAKGFQFLNLGVLAYTGSGSALAQVQVDDARIKSSGKVGFLLWRSVYISKQVSLRNRILVALDWTKTKFFGRDITRI